MTLYNFGKREGLVQSARDTLDATQYAYNTTANNIVLAVKQAYYGVLQANALLRVNEDTVKAVKSRCVRLKASMTSEPGPRAILRKRKPISISLRRISSRLETVWTSPGLTLLTRWEWMNYPKQPLAEDLSIAPFPMSLDEAKKTAFAARPELLQFDGPA